MSLFLIDKDGTILRREGERFVVSIKALDLIDVRATDVDVIVLVGRVELTRAAIDLATSLDIPVYFTSSNGRMSGAIHPGLSAHPMRRSQQYAVFADASRCLEFSKASTKAQISNQRALLRRLAIKRSDNAKLLDARKNLKTLANSIGRQQGVSELRGIEGYATRLFFGGIRSVLDPTLGFIVRAVRADKDPFNCVLDALGGLLSQVCRSAVEAAGLDPFKGAIHGSSRNSPALALDLEDIFRPPIVMSIAVTLFTKKILEHDDFIVDNKKCSLGKKGFAKLCKVFGKKIHREVIRNNDAVAHSYLEHIFLDATDIASWIEGKSSTLEFFEVK